MFKYSTISGPVAIAGLTLMLALGGCGGGSDGTPTTGTPTDPPPPPPPSNLTALFAAAQDANGDAVMAGKDAMDAEMAATKNAMMLTTTEVGGDSKKAMMSAQAILDARDDAIQAVKDAEMALADAKKAKMDAMGIADDHPQKSALTAAIDAAIKAAEAQIAAAKKVRDGTKIRNAVAEVTGGAQGTGTPRSIANAVGMDIAGALAVGTTRGGTRIAHGATEPGTDVAKAHKYQTDDHQGMTWAEIVGKDNVMMERLGTDNAAVPVASIVGMTAATTITSFDATNLPTATGAAGNYMGIPGMVYCLGDDCKVTDGKLAGSWYFSPTSAMAYYQMMTDDPETDADESLTYEAETLYASYGHWLTVSGTDWTVNTFASTNSANTNANLAAGTEANKLKDKATYSGMAAGMSVRKMGSGDSATTDSGRFTADVNLTAMFGATPTVRGTIDNFKGDAVGSGWSVNLESTTLQLSSESTPSVATGSGRDGEWSAQAYGDDAAARPAGIFGGFTAHFTDGDAAGAFATRMDK